MSMPYLSLWQPWASAVAIGAKRIETRHWPTDYRGDVAIFATLTWNEICLAALNDPLISTALEKVYGYASPAMKWIPKMRRVLPFGAVVAVAKLTDCQTTSGGHWGTEPIFLRHPTLDTPRERAFGNYEPGRFGLVLENVCALPVPVPMRGRQGKLVALDADVEAQVLEQVIKAGGAGPEYFGGVK